MVRPAKAAKVEEIRERLSSAEAAVLTEYRGLSVPELAALRASLRGSGTTYKIYKNTLARRAAEAAGVDGELGELLVGPTAFAFVEGDVVGAAKALRDYSRSSGKLVIKGGLLEGRFVSAEQVDEIAQLPTRDELLARMAGAFQGPMRRAAGLFSALQRNTAYAVKALIDKRVEAGEEPPPEEEPPGAATEAGPAPASEAEDSSTEEASGSSGEDPGETPGDAEQPDEGDDEATS